MMLEGMLPLDKLLHRDRRAGGVIRHSLDHGDLGIENVSLNNLLAAANRLAADVQGNKFPAQFVLSPVFWERAMAAARQHSIIPEYVQRDRYGGLLGIVLHGALYAWNGDTVLVYTPHNDVVWELEVGDRHEIIRREQAFALLGPNKGFDLIVPFNQLALQFGAPVHACFAPPRLLLQWIDEGYDSPKPVLEQLGRLPAGQQRKVLLHWQEQGWTDSAGLLAQRGLLAPELAGLLEAPAPEA
ncbi:MAG: hypothetical protein IT318_20340 [Anaerolineales bacterium]|nr:hypothetical protein [Anaerolineales bacterium]